MLSVAIYARKGVVYFLPTIGFVDVGPVFKAAVDAGEVAAALGGAIAAMPEQVMPDLPADYRSPIIAAMKGGIAYERGLQCAVLRFDDDGYRFYRYVPHPKYKVGMRREEDPVFTVSLATPIPGVANAIVAALNDSTWPIRPIPAPRRRKG